ncbi:MAG TPA: rhodanese-like domain-containing protein [Flavisolibacter sp.]|jgi:phage shock protein E|nr:rhodanese-like domain-containing protein [Flavisolibacter sp.]
MKEILNKASVVDVRTPSEYLDGHYPGAVNIPLNELAQRLNEFREMKKPIVAYCRSGARSGMAVSLLKQNGFSEVYNGGGLFDLYNLNA